jgi:bleomycin hydrolase
MKKAFLFISVFSVALFAHAQERTNKKDSQIRFSAIKEAKGTAVKDQYHSSTCWVFSTQSFLESEFIRMGKGEVDLSEMWIVRAGYIEKAKRYMRLMGKSQFSPGGEPIDVINLAGMYGLVPQSAYPGMPAGEDKVRHAEMDAVLKAILDAQLKLEEGKLSPNWLNAYIGALDGYLGVPPATFEHNGKKYDPKSFSAMLGFNAEDYVSVTSFTHHPFYTRFALEVPDNWAWESSTNVTMAEMTQITDNATANGYTVEWGTDVSEKYFSHKNGLAVVPEKDWDKLRQGEKDSLWTYPCKERVISQLLRQESFDNLTTQDDHGMQITGQCQDQTGKKYFIVKNSWGTETNETGGYIYVSVPFFQYKTTSILVHKSAVPKDIAPKMGIKL